MAVSRRLRFEILRRDGHRCRYCGATPDVTELHVDHVVPVSLGGLDDPTNLVAACRDCNRGKASIAPDAEIVADVNADALRWAAAMEHAAELRRWDWAQMDEKIARFDREWRSYKVNATGEEIERDDDWRDSIERFLNADLNHDDLVRLIRQAMHSGIARDPWRFFCGKCWAEIRTRQEWAVEFLPPSATDEAR
jgi:hypothetical protein